MRIENCTIIMNESSCVMVGVDEQKDFVGNTVLTSQWMPIETAPKDGTVVDLWCGDQRLAKCKWFPDPLAEGNEPAGEWRQSYAEIEAFSLSVEGAPTYWMPLPQAPKVTKP